jgi:serine/threonine protein kinase
MDCYVENNTSQTACIMTSYSVARSQGDASESEALPYSPTEQLSFTYAFQSVTITNNLYLLTDTEIGDTRVYLGEGATSSVYKTSIAPFSRKIPPQMVAIKQKRRRGSWFDDDVSLESWLRSCYLDVRIMAHHGLQEAKNVAPAIGYFWERVEVDGIQRLSPCLAMPAAAEGMSSLDTFFNKIRAVGGRTALQGKLLLAHQIANGVRELHRCGIVHGDLKLPNILMFPNIVGDKTEFIAKISDFSHSVVLDDYKMAPEYRIPLYRGTRPFMIPEVRLQDQFMNDPSKMAHISGIPKIPLSRYAACDVYALGLVLFSVFMDGVTLFDFLQELFEPVSVSDGNIEQGFDMLPADVEISTFLHEVVFKSCFGLDDTTGPDVGKCLDTCLQDDPSARGEASAVCRILARHIPSIVGPEG